MDYARKRGACGFSLADIKALKSDSYQNTRGVSVEDYRSILALVDRTTDLGVRDYAILRLLWDNSQGLQGKATKALGDLFGLVGIWGLSL